jgi:hypothetical protein
MRRPAISELARDYPAEHSQLSISRGAFSVAQWCRYRGICPATFYNRLPHGEMPAVLKIGRRTIITAEADEEWRVRMERQPATPAPVSPVGRRI